MILVQRQGISPRNPLRGCKWFVFPGKEVKNQIVKAAIVQSLGAQMVCVPRGGGYFFREKAAGRSPFIL